MIEGFVRYARSRVFRLERSAARWAVNPSSDRTKGIVVPQTEQVGQLVRCDLSRQGYKVLDGIFRVALSKSLFTILWHILKEIAVDVRTAHRSLWSDCRATQQPMHLQDRQSAIALVADVDFTGLATWFPSRRRLIETDGNVVRSGWDVRLEFRKPNIEPAIWIGRFAHVAVCIRTIVNGLEAPQHVLLVGLGVTVLVRIGCGREVQQNPLRHSVL